MKNTITTFITISFLSLFFSSCFEAPKEPVAPIWDIELNLPVGSKTFSIEDIVNKQSQISILPTKTLKFATEKIEQDTTLDFLFSNTFDMEADTSFPVIGTSIEINMIAGRDSVRMDSAEIQDGEVKYRFENSNSFPVSINVIFPGFTRTNGASIDTFQIAANVPANQTIQLTVPVSNYKYKQPPNQPFGSTRPGIWIKVKVNSSVIGIGQNLRVKFQIENLRFRSFHGKVKPFNIGSKRQTIENALSGELKDFVKAVTFNQAFLTLTMSTTVKGFDVLLKGFKIIGKYKDGTPSTYLLFDGNPAKDILIPAGQTKTEILSTLNTNINQFIKATPDSIEVEATIIMNPQYNSGSIYSADKVSFTSQLEAYSQMKIENAVITDTAEIDWDKETKDKLSQGNQANLELEITNALPFEIQFTGYFLDKNNNKLFYYSRQSGSGTPDDTLINISAANINSQGEVNSPTKSIIKFSLNKNDFEKFKDVAAMVNRFKISSAQNQTVIVKADDYVKVKVLGRINYQIKK